MVLCAVTAKCLAEITGMKEAFPGELTTIARYSFRSSITAQEHRLLRAVAV